MTKRLLGTVPLLVMLAFFGVVQQARAQDWPSKPIRLVVPFPPGGVVDLVARQLQPHLQAALGQPLIIENRGGAGGTTGVSEVVRATPDGYTFAMVFDSYATYPLVYPKLGFDVLKDLQPVSQVASGPLVLVVHPDVRAKDVKSLVLLAKERPGKLNYASVGAGSSNHLTAELFKSVTGTFITHIPYRGGGPAQHDLLGGQVEIMFLSAVLAQPHVRTGKLRALAQTGATRTKAFADLPTVAESGYPGFEVSSWVGLLAPAGVPQSIVDRMHREVLKVLEKPEVASRLTEQGLTPIGSTPGQFAKVLRQEGKRWSQLVSQRALSME